MKISKQLLGFAVMAASGLLVLTASVKAASPRPQIETQVEPAAPVAPAAAGEPAPAPKSYFYAWNSDEKGQSYLGVDIRDVTSDRVAALKLKEERGAEITMVDQDAPAGKAGLKEGDVILEFNGSPVESEETLRRMIRETPAGRTVTLGISRDGQPQQIKVTLGSRKEMMKYSISSLPRIAPMPAMPAMPPMDSFDVEIPAISVRSYSMVTGVVLEGLTPQLRDFFGVKGDAGVLVRSVEKGSAAETAGFKAGDVIVKAAGEEINDRSDWSRIIRTKPGKIAVVVIRDKKEATLNLDVPQRRKMKEGSFLWQGDEGNAFEIFNGDNDHDWDIDVEDGPDHDMVRTEHLRHMEDAVRRVAPRIQVATDMAREEVAQALACAQAESEHAVARSREKVAVEMAKNQEKIARALDRARGQAERSAARSRQDAERALERSLRVMQRVRLNDMI